MLKLFIQSWVVITGLPALWLLTNPSTPDSVMWGCAIGLAGQPAWFIATAIARQWGHFILAICYSTIYLRGLLPHVF